MSSDDHAGPARCCQTCGATAWGEAYTPDPERARTWVSMCSHRWIDLCAAVPELHAFNAAQREAHQRAVSERERLQ